jgi:hypothetical protein
MACAHTHPFADFTKENTMKSIRHLIVGMALCLMIPALGIAAAQPDPRSEYINLSLRIEAARQFLANDSDLYVPLLGIFSDRIDVNTLNRDSAISLMTDIVIELGWSQDKIKAEFDNLLRANVQIRNQVHRDIAAMEQRRNELYGQFVHAPLTPLGEHWQGGLDAASLSAALARPRGAQVDFQCSDAAVQHHADGTVELVGDLQCTLTVTRTQASGITWSRHVYHIDFKPLGAATSKGLKVEQRVQVQWQYVEKNQRHEKLSDRAPRQLPVHLRKDGDDELMILANGIAGVFGDVPWRLKPYTPAPMPLRSQPKPIWGDDNGPQPIPRSR